MMVEQLSQVKKHIIERDRFLIDFDKARHDLASEMKKAEANPGANALIVVQKRHDERQEAYVRKNEEVLAEMNDVYRNRNIFTELQMVTRANSPPILLFPNAHHLCFSTSPLSLSSSPQQVNNSQYSAPNSNPFLHLEPCPSPLLQQLLNPIIHPPHLSLLQSVPQLESTVHLNNQEVLSQLHSLLVVAHLQLASREQRHSTHSRERLQRN